MDFWVHDTRYTTPVMVGLRAVSNIENRYLLSLWDHNTTHPVAWSSSTIFWALWWRARFAIYWNDDLLMTNYRRLLSEFAQWRGSMPTAPVTDCWKSFTDIKIEGKGMVKTLAFVASSDFMHEHMMTSSNGNIFHVTGHLCGEFTGDLRIPHTKASDAELWCLLWSAPE